MTSEPENSPIPMIAEAGEREARTLRDHAIALLRSRLGESRTRVAVLNAREVTSVLAALSTPATLDNTAVEEATAVIRAHAARIGVPSVTIAADTPTQVNEGDR